MFSLFTFAKVISTNCKHVCVALTCSYQLMITRIRAICIKLKLIYKNVISTIFVEIQFSGISLLSWTFRKSTEFETTNLYRTPVLIFFNLYFTKKNMECIANYQYKKLFVKYVLILVDFLEYNNAGKSWIFKFIICWTRPRILGNIHDNALMACCSQ